MDNVKDAVQSLTQRLFDKHGEVTSSMLVEAAKDKKEPAHAGFEWNDTKAGHEFRLIQARKWLRVVVVKADEQPERLVHVPVVARQGESEGAYKPASVVVQNVDEFERALSEAMQRLNSARAAVDTLRALAEQSDKPERAAMVAQIARGLDIMQHAMQMTH